MRIKLNQHWRKVIIILIGASLIYILAPLYFCFRTYLKFEMKVLKLALDETNSEVDLNFYIPTLRMFRGLNTGITIQMPMKNKLAEFKFANQYWRHLEIFNYIGKVKINYVENNNPFFFKEGENKLHLLILINIKCLFLDFNVKKEHILNLVDGKSKGEVIDVETIRIGEAYRKIAVDSTNTSQTNDGKKDFFSSELISDNQTLKNNSKISENEHLLSQLTIKEIKDVETYEKIVETTNYSFLVIAVKGTLHVPDYLNLKIDNFTCTFHTSEGKLCILDLAIENKSFEGTFLIDERYFKTIYSAMRRFEKNKKIGILFTHKSTNKYCSPLIKHIIESFCLILDSNGVHDSLFKLNEQIKIEMQQHEKNKLNVKLSIHSSLFRSKTVFQFLKKLKVEFNGHGVVDKKNDETNLEKLFTFNLSNSPQSYNEQNRIVVDINLSNFQFYSVLGYFLEPKDFLLCVKVVSKSLLARLISMANIYFDWRGGIFVSFFNQKEFKRPSKRFFEDYCGSPTMFLKGSVVEKENSNIAKLCLTSENFSINHIVIESSQNIFFAVKDSFKIILEPTKLGIDLNKPIHRSITICKPLECDLEIFNFKKTSSDLAKVFKEIGLFDNKSKGESKFEYQGFEFKNMCDIRTIEFFLRLQGRKIKNTFLQLELNIPNIYVTLVLATKDYGLDSPKYFSINNIFGKKSEDEDLIFCDIDGNFFNPHLKSFLEQENKKINLKPATKVEITLSMQRFKAGFSSKNICIFPDPSELIVTLKLVNFSNFQVPFIGFIVLPEKNNLFSDFIYRNFRNSCIDVFDFIKKTKREPRTHPPVTKYSKNNMTLTGKTILDVLYKKDTNDIFLTGAYTFKHESLGNFYRKYKNFIDRNFFTEWAYNFETKFNLNQPQTILQTETIEITFGNSWIKIYPMHVTLLSDSLEKQSNFYFNFEFKISAKELDKENSVYLIYGSKNKISISINLKEIFKRFDLKDESDKNNSSNTFQDHLTYSINEACQLRPMGNCLLSNFKFQYFGDSLKHLEKLGYLIRRINLMSYPKYFDFFSCFVINFDVENSVEIRINALFPIYYDKIEKLNLEDQQKLVQGNFLMKKSTHPALNLGVYIFNYFAVNQPAGFFRRMFYKILILYLRGADYTSFSRNTVLFFCKHLMKYKFRKLIKFIKYFSEKISPDVKITVLFDSEVEKEKLGVRISNYVKNMTFLKAIKLANCSESIFKHFITNNYDLTIEVTIKNIVVYKEKIRFHFVE